VEGWDNGDDAVVVRALLLLWWGLCSVAFMRYVNNATIVLIQPFRMPPWNRGNRNPTSKWSNSAYKATPFGVADQWRKRLGPVCNPHVRSRGTTKRCQEP
jgi:hypothetical protein